MTSSSHLITFHLVGESVEPEALNKKALDIVQRVRDKLTGKDFNTEASICEIVQQIRHVGLTPFLLAGEFGGVRAGGASDQSGDQPREPVPVLHWLVSLLVRPPLLGTRTGDRAQIL